MANCVSKCAPDVANGTGVKSGVSWVPDGVILIHLIHQEQSLMVPHFGELIFHSVVFCWWWFFVFQSNSHSLGGRAHQNVVRHVMSLACEFALAWFWQSKTKWNKNSILNFSDSHTVTTWGMVTCDLCVVPTSICSFTENVDMLSRVKQDLAFEEFCFLASAELVFHDFGELRGKCRGQDIAK